MACGMHRAAVTHIYWAFPASLSSERESEGLCVCTARRVRRQREWGVVRIVITKLTIPVIVVVIIIISLRHSAAATSPTCFVATGAE